MSKYGKNIKKEAIIKIMMASFLVD